MDSKTAQKILDSAQAAMGTILFKELTTKMNKAKVPKNRDQREQVPWKVTRKLAKRRHWICGICQDPENRMADDRKYTVLDHIDPQRIDFNNPSNWQAAHKSCNAKKAAMNQTELSKLRQLNPTMGDGEDIRPEP